AIVIASQRLKMSVVALVKTPWILCLHATPPSLSESKLRPSRPHHFFPGLNPAVKRIRVFAAQHTGRQGADQLRLAPAQHHVIHLQGGFELAERSFDMPHPLLVPESFQSRFAQVISIRPTPAKRQI